MIKEGSKVKVHYTGRLTNNEEFDSSLKEGGEPIEFVIGQGQLIPGFENGVLGLSTGDKKTIEIPAVEAYGEYRDELRVTVPKTNAPQGVQVGQSLQANMQNGEMVTFMVREVNDDNVIVDANHPLAGQTLLFDVEILEVA
jgi:FKBP-type peptidyl-prolyl cis-trans isomerase SlpA